jgi:hypothetical protein
MEPNHKPNINPWAIFRCHPPATNICIKRFRRRQDAESYLSILRGMMPEAQFLVVFDQG